MGFTRQEYWSGLPFSSPIGENTLYHIQNLAWIKDKNVRAKNTKLLQEKISINLCNLELSNGFLKKKSGGVPKAQTTKEKMIHWNSSKLQLCTSKTPSRK